MFDQPLPRSSGGFLRRPAHGAPKPPAQVPHTGPAKPSDDPVAPGGTPKTIEPFEGELPKAPAPVPVKVIGNIRSVTTRNRRPVVTLANHMDANSVVALPANPRRAAAIVLNPLVRPDGTAQTLTIVILGGRSDNPNTGFPLIPGASIVVCHQQAVYSVCPLATQSAGAILSIYGEVEADT